MSEREKEVWRDIFELYRDLPCLWKTNHDHYHNKDMRSQAMLLLYEKYKSFDKDVTLAVFKKKLENMRTSYGRERKKIMNSTQTGASSGDVYVPTLWYYELLTFLDEKDLAARKGVQTEVSDDEDIIPEVPPAKKQKMVSSLKKKQEQLLDATNKLINAKEDDWEVIGRFFGVQLRDLSANQKPIAKKLMCDVIFYGSTEQLTNNSYISIPSPSPSTTSVPFPLSPPLPPTLKHTPESNHPRIILKSLPKPSSTITSSSPPPKVLPFPLTSSQYKYKENLYIPQSPLPPTPRNHPKIVIQQSLANKQPQTSSQINTNTIIQDEAHDYGDHESPLSSTPLNHPKVIITQSFSNNQTNNSQINTNTISHDYSE